MHGIKYGAGKESTTNSWCKFVRFKTCSSSKGRKVSSLEKKIRINLISQPSCSNELVAMEDHLSIIDSESTENNVDMRSE